MARKKKPFVPLSRDEFPPLSAAEQARASLVDLNQQLAKAIEENRMLRENSSPTNQSGRLAMEPNDGHRFVEKLYQNAPYYGNGPTIVGTTSPTSPRDAMELAKEGKLRPYHFSYEPDAAVHALSQVRMVHDRLDRVEEMLRFLCRRGG